MGRKAPKKVRKSRWWRRFRWILALWAIGVTGLVIVFGVLGAWDAFADGGHRDRFLGRRGEGVSR